MLLNNVSIQIWAFITGMNNIWLWQVAKVKMQMNIRIIRKTHNLFSQDPVSFTASPFFQDW